MKSTQKVKVPFRYDCMTVLLLYYSYTRVIHVFVSSLSCSHIIVFVKRAPYIIFVLLSLLFRQYGSLFSIWPTRRSASWTPCHRYAAFFLPTMGGDTLRFESKCFLSFRPTSKTFNMLFIVLFISRQWILGHLPHGVSFAVVDLPRSSGQHRARYTFCAFFSLHFVSVDLFHVRSAC